MNDNKGDFECPSCSAAFTLAAPFAPCARCGYPDLPITLRAIRDVSEEGFGSLWDNFIEQMGDDVPKESFVEGDFVSIIGGDHPSMDRDGVVQEIVSNGFVRGEGFARVLVTRGSNSGTVENWPVSRLVHLVGCSPEPVQAEEGSIALESWNEGAEPHRPFLRALRDFLDRSRGE